LSGAGRTVGWRQERRTAPQPRCRHVRFNARLAIIAYGDYGCPWCYIGLQRIEALQGKYKACAGAAAIVSSTATLIAAVAI